MRPLFYFTITLFNFISLLIIRRTLLTPFISYFGHQKIPKDMTTNQIIIENKIYELRGIPIMLDNDLANLFQVETKALNKSVKRNIERFPNHYMFQLTIEEWNSLRFQIGTSSETYGGRRFIPYAFSEQGVAMLSAILRSEIAIKVSLQIMDAFVSMRKLVRNNILLEHRLSQVELKYLETEQKFNQIFNALESKDYIPQKGIFFEGQIFDAYMFISNIIRSAKNSIILFDNYIDDSILTQLDKRDKTVSAVIYTQQVDKKLQLDILKHNSQYPPIEIKVIKTIHDRFLMIDEIEVYHIGASLKDAGKKWFAFSKLTDFAPEILNRLRQF
jgi:hypothetical protein